MKFLENRLDNSALRYINTQTIGEIVASNTLDSGARVYLTTLSDEVVTVSSFETLDEAEQYARNLAKSLGGIVSSDGRAIGGSASFH